MGRQAFKKVIILACANDRRIEFEVSRATKKITICSTISMAGDVLPPLIISQRKTIDEDVYNARWRDGQDSFMRIRNEDLLIGKFLTTTFLNMLFPI